MSPIISAVMTSYNRGDFLAQCLWTVFELGNGCVPDEVVVCDDRSTDGTMDICAGLSKRYPIRVIRRNGDPGWQNPSIPRNIAFRATRADATLLWMLEPEVLVFPGTLRLLLNHFGETDRKNIWVNATHQGFLRRRLQEQEWQNPEWVWHHIENNALYVDPSPHLAVRCALVPREVVFILRGYNETFYGWGHDDSDWMTRLQTYGCRREDDFGIRILHQAHDPAPADGRTADANLAISQADMRAGVYAVNDPELWGTDSGKIRL
jgi:glycosyltransferase involved in cell wall biosynthesis